MSEWERHANASLRALSEAYQQGSIDRSTYRARRRLLLQALIAHEEVTVPTPAKASDSNDDMAMLLASRSKFQISRVSLVLLIIVISLLVTVWLTGGWHG